ncbi:hypothetical protein BH09BAC3_BH09BAC3_00440 [soil metagenome]
MKSVPYILILFFSSGSLSGFSQQGNDAGSYLSFIGAQYEEISKDMMSYSSAVAHGKGARKVEKRRNELMLQLKESERNVRKMKPFRQSSKLRDSVASYMRICQIVLNEDYGKIVNLEDVAEQSYDDMEAYLLAKDIANEKLDEANERVSDQYDAFAKENNIRLIETSSKLTEKIRAAGKVNEYQKSIYLLFFKSFKNDVYFVDALNKGDINAMEQSKNSLQKSSTDDLLKLGPIQSFQGDATLKNACQQMLTFYKKEAIVLGPVLIDFYLKKDNFDKIKKAFDASRTKTTEQSDVYNKAVLNYNASLKKFNVANDECNKSRSALLDKWNQASENFIDNHTPKYR